MANQRTCVECGQAVPSNSPGELCAACLMRAGLRDETLSFHPKGSQSEQTGDPTSPSAMPATPIKQLAAGDEFGGYKIVRRLGRGGMGVVYEADQTETGRRVALKVLARSLDNTEARKRFLREGRLAASINHPNSVYVFGTDEIEDVPIISMELVRGGTLAEQVAKQGSLPVARAVDAILQVIDGLEAAREKGVLHRDVKPANCFVETDGTVKIGDFGLSISTSPRDDISHTELTFAGQVLGTPAFASPEQLRGDELDIRSDIYSVAVTLFYLLTGDTPFRGKNLVQLLATVLEQPAPRVDQLRPDVPKGLANVIARCLHKLPEQRFRDYDSLRQALSPFGKTAPSPALLGLRTLANLIDKAVLATISWAFTLLIYPGVLPVSELRMMNTLPLLIASLMTYTWAILYYGLSESIWGASIGKAVLRLRVVDRRGSSPTLWRSLARSFVFVVWPTLFAITHSIVYAGATISELATGPAMLTVMLLGPAQLLMLLLLFSTARRANGYAGVHDRIGGVTVVSRQREPGRRPWVVPDLPLPQLAALPAIGPFSVLDKFSRDGGDELLLAYDPKLLRRVWVHKRNRDAKPIPEAVRNISRPGRLRWLASGVEDDSVWDAYEAPRGVPVIEALGDDPEWSSIRYWLSDLADELRIASNDGTLPELLAIERLWIGSDGRLKLLDFPAPGLTNIDQAVQPVTTESDAGESCIQFMAAVSSRVIGSQDRGQRRSPLLLPLSARTAIGNLANLTTLDAISQCFRDLLHETPAVTRKRRFGLLLSCVALSISVCITLLMTQLVMKGSMEATPELLELSQAASLLDAYGDSSNHQQTIKKAEMIRTWITGHHRKTVETPEMWDSLISVSFFQGVRRQEIERLVRRPIPTEEQLREADAVVQPLLDQLASASQHQTQRHALFSPEIVPGMMAIVWLEFVWFPSLFTALLFRGGLLMRLFNVVAVRRDGKRASGLRMFWRALVPAPLAILLGFIGTVRLAGTEFLPEAMDAGSWVGLLLVVFLLVLSAWHPQRSISDRLAGTYLVPR